MNKILYLQCNMGAAGDMINAALFELLSDEDKEKYLKVMNRDDLDICVSPEKNTKCGIVGTHMNVYVKGQDEGDMMHEHSHDHGHHHHASLHDVEHIIDSYELPKSVKEKALSVYKLIAEAESHAHNKPVSEVHFHEVGMKDAIADVVGACFLLSLVNPDRIIISPVNVGFGHVHCTHGILPVPAPATAYILKNAPIYQGMVEGEMCTPTGAALLMAIKSDFGSMPVMTVEKTGYGMGKKEFPEANCIRAFLGYEVNMEDNVLMEKSAAKDSEQILELSCNIDDMTGEELSYAADELMKSGALDVYIEPIIMKKGRPANKLVCMCKVEMKQSMTELILKNTTSWGVRARTFDRCFMERHIETVSTEYGDVRVKIGEYMDIKKWKAEYEDIAKIAKENGLSLREIESIVAGKMI